MDDSTSSRGFTGACNDVGAAWIEESLHAVLGAREWSVAAIGEVTVYLYIYINKKERAEIYKWNERSAGVTELI